MEIRIYVYGLGKLSGIKRRLEKDGRSCGQPNPCRYDTLVKLHSERGEAPGIPGKSKMWLK